MRAEEKDVRAREKPVRAPRIKSEDLLPKIEPLPGAVCAQMVRCGRSNCKCAKGDLHGPYFYRFFYIGGQLHKKYVKKCDVSNAKAACLAYRRQLIQQRELIRSINESGNTILRAMREMLRGLRL